MRVLICGGRGYNDEALFQKTMEELSTRFDFDGHQPVTIIHGSANGTDTMAHYYAAECGWDCLAFPADWERHGRAAGPIRNQQMLDEGKPELVVAFPGGRGTANMVSKARKASIPVVTIKCGT